jgi:hypothetical protein
MQNSAVPSVWPRLWARGQGIVVDHLVWYCAHQRAQAADFTGKDGVVPKSARVRLPDESMMGRERCRWPSRLGAEVS